MASHRFIKVNGAVLLAAGLLIAIFTLLHPTVDDYSEVVHTARWNIVHAGVGIGLLLALIGLVGLYLQVAGEGDLYGMVGFYLALIGTSLSSGMYLIHEGVLLPALDSLGGVDVLLAPEGQIAQTTIFNSIGAAAFVLFALGYILLGIKVLRTPKRERWAGIFLILGGPLFAGPAPTIGAVLLGAGFVWLGFMMLRKELSEQ